MHKERFQILGVGRTRAGDGGSLIFNACTDDKMLREMKSRVCPEIKEMYCTK